MSSFTCLQGHRYLTLTPLKDEESVSAPVWFVLDDDAVYVRTDARSGKVKRIRHDPLVTVTPSDVRGRPRGPAVAARARVMDDAELDRPARLLAAKYAWQDSLYWLMHRNRRTHLVTLEICARIMVIAVILASLCLPTSALAAAATSYWTPARMREAVRNSAPRGAILPTARIAGAPLAKAARTDLPGIKAIGRVFAVKPDGSPWSCTGTLVDSANRSVVWTAGHCIHSGRGGVFYTKLAFAPGYQAESTGNPTPYGLWPAFTSAVTGSWTKRGLANSRLSWKIAQYDAAGLVLARDPQGRTPIDALGVSQHIQFGVRASSSVRMIGYPVAAPYLGATLMQCGPSRTFTRSYAPNLLMIPCPLTHGMSGGPALTRIDANGVGTVIGEMSLTDYKHMYVARHSVEQLRLYHFLESRAN